LLKQGASIRFKSGYKFVPDLKLNEIHLVTPLGLPDGQIKLDREGLSIAYFFKEGYERILKRNVPKDC
jgi:hypothetical protein